MKRLPSPELSTTETVSLVTKRRYNVSARARQNALDYLERLIEDHEAPDGAKIKAVECLLKMDLVDIAADKDDAAATAAATAEPQIVLLLPPNGTEANQ